MSYQPYSSRGTERYKDGSLSNNQAEAIVEAYFASIDRPLVRYGFQGVPTERAVAMTWPPAIRHSPDYLGFGKFIEVKSCWDETALLKVEDLESLEFWNFQMPVWIALYQGRTNRIILADLPSWKWAAAQQPTDLVVLDEGTRAEKQAYQIPVDLLTGLQVANAFEAAKVHPVVAN